MSIPDELSLLSLFECEPKLLDNNAPYFYNEATYEFSNYINEKFVVCICPSYSDIKIGIYSADNNELLSFLDFRSADKIEILSDKREESKIKKKLKEPACYMHNYLKLRYIQFGGRN